MGVATLDYLRKLYVEEIPLPPFEPVPIAVCCPLYNSMPFLNIYMSHVLKYDWPKDLVSLYFTIQGDDETWDFMKDFRASFGDSYRKIKIEKVKQVKGGELPHVRNVTNCRNLLAKWSKPDPVFFNDHDNFNPPHAMRRHYDALRLGADGAAGIYFFSQMDEVQKRQMATFTAFFLHGGTMRGLTLQGMEGTFPLEVFRHRLWMDAVSFGCFMGTRELMDSVKFFVPFGTTMTDDTAWCLKAREKGFRFIADFTMLIPHWGFRVSHIPLMKIRVERATEMLDRRLQMEDDGVYVTPDLDSNMTDKVREMIDIDEIEKKGPQNE